jgi:glucose/arabinose dehydrogenase
MPTTSRAAARTLLVLLVALVLASAGCSGDAAPDEADPARSAGAGPSRSSSATTTSPSAGASRAARPRVAGDVATGLSVPWGLAFLPDGTALVSERDTERVKAVDESGEVRVVGRVAGVDGSGEGGLLGLAVSPGYATDSTVFAYFTRGSENVVARMTYDGEGLSDQRTVLDGIPAGPIHNGGRIAFGPDGYLYVGTGESGQSDLSQDRDSLGGKILRITPDGDPAPGNPFAGSPVWSLGHRNVQGLAWDDEGRMWAAEFGQNTWDELNRIEPGENYGWPVVEGRAGDDRYVDPVRQWRTSEASPSGIAVADGSVFMAALGGTRLWQVPLLEGADGRTGRPRASMRERYGRLRTVVAAPDGSLWVTTSNRDGRGAPRDGDDRIVRLTFD